MASKKVTDFLLDYVCCIPDWPIIPQFMRSKKAKDGAPRTINVFLGFFFMVNFILGTGFLGIPFGFFHGGILVGIATMTVVGSMSWLCSLWILDSMARAQALTDHRKLLETYSEKETDVDKLPTQPNFYISVHRKFEPSEMCEIFFNRWLKVIYLALFVLYSFLACLSYSTVTGSAWSVNLPLNFGTLEQCTSNDFFHQLLPDGGCLNSYRFCLLLFALIVVPLSLLDLKEQVVVQFALGVLRFVTLAAIILYCLAYMIQGYMVADCKDPIPTLKNTSSYWYKNTSSISDMVFRFDINGWLISVPVFVYAVALQQGIVSLTHPIKQKNWLRALFNTLFIIVILLYITLGIVVAFWFRDGTNETCTLNWGPLKSPGHNTAIRALSYYIILFPSIDICSVFPLVIHTIVNNVYTVVFGKDTSQVSGWKHCLIQVGLKFVVSILPITIALFVSNLVYVLKYGGLVGFPIVFVSPIVLQLSSQWISYNTFRYMAAEDEDVKKVPGGKSLELEPIKENKTEEEETLLPEEEAGDAKKTSRKVFEFFFTCKNSFLYKTPYSTILGHPLCVVFVFCLVVICFLLTSASLFVHPSEPSCT